MVSYRNGINPCTRVRRHTQSTMGKCFTFVFIRVTKRRRNRSRLFSIFSLRCKRCGLVSDSAVFIISTLDIHSKRFSCSDGCVRGARESKGAKERRSADNDFSFWRHYIFRVAAKIKHVREKNSREIDFCFLWKCIFVSRADVWTRRLFNIATLYLCIMYNCIQIKMIVIKHTSQHSAVFGCLIGFNEAFATIFVATRRNIRFWWRC